MKITLFFLTSIFLISGSGYAQQEPAKQPKPIAFREVAEKRLEKRKQKLEDVCPVDTNIVAARVFKDYGAMFVAASDVQPPIKCVFANEEEVVAFQKGVPFTSQTIGSRTVELQEAAMKALDKARAAATKKGMSITPRGQNASRRGYADTYRIWKSRFDPALAYWVKNGKISEKDADRARKMETTDQVIQVIEWEKSGLWFSTGFNRSIFSSVAAPGTSQHLSGIALDVAEFSNRQVRTILNEHGWFQTIIDDTPHFTYLGLDEDELTERGLIPAVKEGYTFWIPNFDRDK